jgi:hypothetical protein
MPLSFNETMEGSRRDCCWLLEKFFRHDQEPP